MANAPVVVAIDVVVVVVEVVVETGVVDVVGVGPSRVQPVHWLG